VTRRDLVIYSGILIVLGAGWAITLPLSKIAVSTGHGVFGLIFWQLVIGAVLMGLVTLIRGTGLPLTRVSLVFFTVIALIGTVIPNASSYKAVAHLPAGVISILMSLIPMIAFPIALGLRLERFRLKRFVGLLAGLVGVSLLVVPKASLPDAAMLAWIPLALVGPLFYAFEGNFVAKWGTHGLDAIQVLFGASVIGAVITLPLAIMTGQYVDPIRPWGAPEWALVISSVVHVLVYAGYVWLVGRTGAVFAMQVSYLVTGFGVFWAMLLLGESYSPYIWAALGLMLVGVFLVQPRPNDTLAPDAAI
jgi:drug/metabolite transporter (DMT)-like permease